MKISAGLVRTNFKWVTSVCKCVGESFLAIRQVAVDVPPVAGNEDQ